MKKFEIIFQPSGVRGEVFEAKSILEAWRELGVEIESLCGGRRACGKCKVKLVEGSLSAFTDDEAKFITERERVEGYRLGCAAQIRGDVSILVPEESRPGKQVLRKAATGRSIELNPAIHPYYVELSLPSLEILMEILIGLKRDFSKSIISPHSVSITMPC